MISRRNFIKLAGLSTVALGAGYTSGKLIGKSRSEHYSVHGFIPSDEKIIKKLITAFRNKVKSNADPVIVSDLQLKQMIGDFDLPARNGSFSNNGAITYRIEKLNGDINSDLIASDEQNSIYSVDDLNNMLFNLRNDIRNKKADYLFTAEYDHTGFLSSLFKSNKKTVVLVNQKGLVEKIPLEKNYKNILIDGQIGKTGLRIENGIVSVYSSSCRNSICKHTMASFVGNIIACAPNRVLIKIDLA